MANCWKSAIRDLQIAHLWNEQNYYKNINKISKEEEYEGNSAPFRCGALVQSYGGPACGPHHPMMG